MPHDDPSFSTAVWFSSSSANWLNVYSTPYPMHVFGNFSIALITIVTVSLFNDTMLHATRHLLAHESHARIASIDFAGAITVACFVATFCSLAVRLSSSAKWLFGHSEDKPMHIFGSIFHFPCVVHFGLVVGLELALNRISRRHRRLTNYVKPHTRLDTNTVLNKLFLAQGLQIDRATSCLYIT